MAKVADNTSTRNPLSPMMFHEGSSGSSSAGASANSGLGSVQLISLAEAREQALANRKLASADVLEILTPIWHTKSATARYVHHRVRAVLEWAVAMNWRRDNPCDRLLPVLGPQHDVVEHRKALPHREVAAAVETVRAARPGKVDTLAFEFLVLTVARGGSWRPLLGHRRGKVGV